MSKCCCNDQSEISNDEAAVIYTAISAFLGKTDFKITSIAHQGSDKKSALRKLN